MTVKPCNKPAVGDPWIKINKIYRRFLFILTRIMLGLLSQVMQKQTMGKVGTKTII